MMYIAMKQNLTSLLSDLTKVNRKSKSKIATNNRVDFYMSQLSDHQKEKLFEYIMHHYNNDVKGKTVALWGLSFKPNTDDMREASSRVLMERLWEAGAIVQAYDPEAMEVVVRLVYYSQSEGGGNRAGSP